ncbi:hypothetical protein BGW41_008013 [Actinomortierella wolfii]|nr:hypothetical protein BGW41_008013 [Actinomortierella wolfii]
MDVWNGIVKCDWRVDTSDCPRPHEYMLMQVVLGVCVVFYLVLAVIAYGILWARKHYHLTPPGPVIDFKQPDGSIRPKPIEAFCVFSIAGLLIRSVSIILVIIDAFPESTIVKELLANIAIAVHFITLGTVLLLATGLFYFTLNQLAEAIAEYSMPPDLINIHVGVTPTALDGSGGEVFTLSPLPESEREDSVWGTDLSKVRVRLLKIRNVGTVVLFFYVAIYLAYGIARPKIHSHIVWNVFFCVCFNLDPGTPTIFIFFILSILHHRRTEAPKLRQVYSSGGTPVSTPMSTFPPTFRPTRPLVGMLRDELPSHYFASMTPNMASNNSSRSGSLTLPPHSVETISSCGKSGYNHPSSLSSTLEGHLHFVTPRQPQHTVRDQPFNLEDLDIDGSLTEDKKPVQHGTTMTGVDIESPLAKPVITFEIPYPSPPCSTAKSDGSASPRSQSPPSQHSGV